jgi:hypothetical protein
MPKLRCTGRVSTPDGDMLAGTFQDITERRQTGQAELEQHRSHLTDLVQARTKELQAANRQLSTERRAAESHVEPEPKARRQPERRGTACRLGLEEAVRLTRQ